MHLSRLLDHRSDRLGRLLIGGPRQLDLVLVVHVGALDLRVGTPANVAVGKVPQTLALRLVVLEVADEVSAIFVDPLAVLHGARLERTLVLHAGLEEDIGALTVLLATSPLARVDILVLINEGALTVTKAVLPVAVVRTLAREDLLADTILHVVGPATNILVLLTLFLGTKLRESVCALVAVAEALLEGTIEHVTVGVRGDTLAGVVSRGLYSLTEVKYRVSD